MQIEQVVQLVASLPNDSKLRDDLSGQFIKTLWNNLQHPPISYLGEEFKYRKADGSNNVCKTFLNQELILIKLEYHVSESRCRW